MLEDLTKETVEEWNRKYDKYVIRVNQEGTDAIPTEKMLCISDFVLKNFASRSGVTVESLTDWEKQEFLNWILKKESTILGLEHTPFLI